MLCSTREQVASTYIVTGLVRAAVLVHPRGSIRKALDPVLLRATFLRSSFSRGGQDYASSHKRLAGLVSVRYPLSDLADLVQLDRLPAHRKLPSHVCLLKRDGHCT